MQLCIHWEDLADIRRKTVANTTVLQLSSSTDAQCVCDIYVSCKQCKEVDAFQ